MRKGMSLGGHFLDVAADARHTRNPFRSLQLSPQGSCSHSTSHMMTRPATLVVPSINVSIAKENNTI